MRAAADRYGDLLAVRAIDETLRGLHAHGETFAANAIGAANLAVIAQAVDGR